MVGVSGVELADGVERLEWAAQIFGVIPAAHYEHRALHIFHVTRQIARMPIVVVCVVLA